MDHALSENVRSVTHKEQAITVQDAKRLGRVWPSKVQGRTCRHLTGQLSFILVLFNSLIGHPKLHLYSTCLDIHYVPACLVLGRTLVIN